jgi:GxxExxY protein
MKHQKQVLTAESTESTESTEMKSNINEITDVIIGAAIAVHKELGPGLLESAYEACLTFELADQKVKIERRKGLPIKYRGVQLDCGYRIDLLVEDKVVVELRAVQRLEPIHEAQLLSYLKLSGCKVGLLINFNVKVLKDGIRRLVHKYQE